MRYKKYNKKININRYGVMKNFYIKYRKYQQFCNVIIVMLMIDKYSKDVIIEQKGEYL